MCDVQFGIWLCPPTPPSVCVLHQRLAAGLWEKHANILLFLIEIHRIIFDTGYGSISTWLPLIDLCQSYWLAINNHQLKNQNIYKSRPGSGRCGRRFFRVLPLAVKWLSNPWPNRHSGHSSGSSFHCLEYHLKISRLIHCHLIEIFGLRWRYAEEQRCEWRHNEQVQILSGRKSVLRRWPGESSSSECSDWFSHPRILFVFLFGLVWIYWRERESYLSLFACSQWV